MKQIRKLRIGFVIFLLFAGMAIWEGTHAQGWLSATYWSVLAVVFLLLDSGKRPTPEN